MKNGRDQSTKKLQYIRRETIDIEGRNILRLPEERDFFPEVNNPVAAYYSTKNANKRFFDLSFEEKVDQAQLAKPNCLTRPKDIPGLPSFQQYLLKEDKTSRYGTETFAQTMSRLRTHSTPKNRT